MTSEPPVEIASPALFDLALFNRLLARLGVEGVDLKEMAARGKMWGRSG
ncbi:MAG: hypothetical protein HY719_14735 [Planctomycetes bacterium]|nr:hypothetical protein [Planctomycetota bacterium]